MSLTSSGAELRIYPMPDEGWVIITLDSLKLVRYNRCGVSQWSRKFDLPNSTPGMRDFIKTKAGNFALLTRYDNGSVAVSVITLIDANGNVIWCRSIGGSPYEHYCYTISEDHQGNLVIFGNVGNVFTLESYNVIFKMNLSGNIMWSNFYDHGGTWGGAIVTSDNGVLARTGDIFIKTDGNGNVQWTSAVYAASYDYYAPLEVSDGYIYTGFNSSGTQFACVYKLNKQGQLVWNHRKRTNFYGLSPRLIPLTNGNFIAVYLNTGTTNLIEFDKDLQVISQAKLGAASGISLYARSLCFTPSGVPVAAGQTSGSGLFFARMDRQYHTGCDDALPSINLIPEPVTQVFIPTSPFPYTLNVTPLSIQTDSFPVTETTICTLLKTLDLGPDTSLCQGSTITLQNLDGFLFDNYLWSTGETTSAITINQPGTYWLLVNDSCDENSRGDTVFITINAVPAANLGDWIPLCENTTVTMHAPLCSSCTFTWNTGSHSDSMQTDQEGFYWLQVDNNKGCITGDTVLVDEVKCACTLYVPNAFTPNGDVRNESFRPVYDCDISDYEMKIYNRWGELIFISRNPSESWNGRWKNAPAVEGIYVYLISYSPMIKGSVQQPVTKTGTVAVIY